MAYYTNRGMVVMDNNITDTAIVASAVSAPVWLQEVNLLAGIMFAVVGTLIGLVRLYYMIKDRDK
jgi:presenilin-like A22 family membrane protease